jgi:Flp pilus assembly protein TadB
MQSDPDHRLEELASQKLEGKSYSMIREELAASGMKKQEISRLIRKVDERVLKETLEQGNRQRLRQWRVWGLILAVAGLLLTISYKAGILLIRLPALLVYIPFIAGIILMLYARMLERNQRDPDPKGPGPIRKKRPYK